MEKLLILLAIGALIWQDFLGRVKEECSMKRGGRLKLFIGHHIS